MKVRCLYNKGSSLSPRYLAAGNTPQSEFDVIVGQEYVVYGFCVSRGNVDYLLDSHRDSYPSWYPAILFEVLDNRLPPNWQFSYLPQNEEFLVYAIWGYPELVNSAEHFDGLIDRVLSEGRIFFRRRLEMDAMYSEPDEAD